MGVEPDHPSPDRDRAAPGGVPSPVGPPSFVVGDEAPTESLVAGTMGDRCVNCGAPLAADQRYCLYCGTRAPGARIESLEALRAEAAVPPPPAVLARPAASPAFPVLAVVAALRVGALLGHWATQTPQPAASTTWNWTVDDSV